MILRPRRKDFRAAAGVFGRPHFGDDPMSKLRQPKDEGRPPQILQIGTAVGTGDFRLKYFVIDSTDDGAYRIILLTIKLDDAYIMALRRVGAMKRLRGRASTVARLVMLALCLQLALPLLASGAPAAEAGLRADLQSSICHESRDESAPASTADAQGTTHCLFCLPLAGIAGPTAAFPSLPLPLGNEALLLVPADHQAPDSSRPASSRSRAPPSAPRYA